MTEEEWLFGSNLEPMLTMTAGMGSARKIRLFACACCRRVYSEPYEDELACVETAERFADGLVSAEELAEAEDLLDQGDYRFGPADYAVSEDRAAVLGASSAAINLFEYNATAPSLELQQQLGAEAMAHVLLLRDIFRNPFQSFAFASHWRTDTAIAIAEQMYESRDFSAMPILADALHDAGCESDDILSHCRDANATHVRGCWVVDLVLGKS